MTAAHFAIIRGDVLAFKALLKDEVRAYVRVLRAWVAYVWLCARPSVRPCVQRMHVGAHSLGGAQCLLSERVLIALPCHH